MSEVNLRSQEQEGGTLIRSLPVSEDGQNRQLLRASAVS